jgi:uncharacterized protein DUF4266
MLRKIAAVAALLAAFAAMCGCGTVGVKPWQRDLLAKGPMQLDAYPLDTAIDEHVYFSKEASLGGSSLAGGGCGCN